MMGQLFCVQSPIELGDGAYAVFLEALDSYIFEQTLQEESEEVGKQTKRASTFS